MSFRDGASAPYSESRDSGFDASHRPGMTALSHQRDLQIRGAVGVALRLQQLHDLGIGARTAEQKALAFMATFGAQAAHLRLGLHAFRGDGNAEALAEARDRADDRLGVAIGIETAHERLVDLDLVEGKTA